MSNDTCFTDADISQFKRLDLTRNELPPYMQYVNTSGDGNCGWHAILQGIVETYVEYFQMAQTSEAVGIAWAIDDFKHLKKFIEQSSSGTYAFTKEEILRAAYQNNKTGYINFPRKMINKLRQYLLDAKDIIRGQNIRHVHPISHWITQYQTSYGRNDKFSQEFAKFVSGQEELAQDKINGTVETHYFKTPEDEITLMTSVDEGDAWKSDYRNERIQQLTSECEIERNRIKLGITSDGSISSQYWITERILQVCNRIFNLSLFSYITSSNMQAAVQFSYEDMAESTIPIQFKHIIFIKTSGGHFEYIRVTLKNYHQRIFNNFKKILTLSTNETLEDYEVKRNHISLNTFRRERSYRDFNISQTDISEPRSIIDEVLAKQSFFEACKILLELGFTLTPVGQKKLDKSSLEQIKAVEKAAGEEAIKIAKAAEKAERAVEKAAAKAARAEAKAAAKAARTAEREKKQAAKAAERERKQVARAAAQNKLQKALVNANKYKLTTTEEHNFTALETPFTSEQFSSIDQIMKSNNENKIKTWMISLDDENISSNIKKNFTLPSQSRSASDLNFNVVEKKAGKTVQQITYKLSNYQIGEQKVQLFLYLFIGGKLRPLVFLSDILNKFSLNVSIEYPSSVPHKVNFKCKINVTNTKNFNGQIENEVGIKFEDGIIFISKIIFNDGTVKYLYLDKDLKGIKNLQSQLEIPAEESEEEESEEEESEEEESEEEESEEEESEEEESEEEPEEESTVTPNQEPVNDEKSKYYYGPFLYRMRNGDKISMTKTQNETIETKMKQFIVSILKNYISNIDENLEKREQSRISCIEGKMIANDTAFIFNIQTNKRLKLKKILDDKIDNITILLYDLHNKFSIIDKFKHNINFTQELNNTSNQFRYSYFTTVEPICYIIYKYLSDENINKRNNQYIIKYGKETVYADINYCIFSNNSYLHKDYNKLYYKGLQMDFKGNTNQSSDKLKKIIMDKDTFDKFYEKCVETLSGLNNNREARKKMKELQFIYKVLFIMSNNSDLDVYYKIKIDIILNMYKSQFRDPISYDYNLITNTKKLRNNIKKTYNEI
jgi:hypothetical protein